MPSTKRDTDLSVAANLTLADLLRGAFPTHTAKRAAAAGHISHRTVQDWIQRRCCPSADTLLKMAAENEQLRAAMILALQGDAYAGLVTDVAGEAGAAKGQELARRGGTVAAPVAGPARGVARRDGRGRG